MATKIFAIGLPDTGKTTFLAAFWDSLQHGVLRGLRLNRTLGDMEYLNEIRAAWADCRAMPRTGSAADRPARMLVDSQSEREMEVVWTDMLGESFARQWANRTWTQSYQDLVDSSDGAILFLHPSQAWEEPLITEAQELMGPTDEPAEDSDAASALSYQPFDHEHVPTQSKLVELLQFIAGRRGNFRGFRLSVVISAWDLEEGDLGGPEQWLMDRLPMLDSYLRYSDLGLTYEVYGVSAQGGDYANVDELRQIQRPSDRVRVLSCEKEPGLISDPVCFALGISTKDGEP